MGDPNFRPSHKGDFVIDPRGRPKRHFRIYGDKTVYTEEIAPLTKDDSTGIDELMDGITRADLAGRTSSFGNHVLQTYGAAGAGTPDRRDLRRQNEYGNAGMEGSPPTDQGWEFSEDVGESDLFGQPATYPRREYGEFVDPDESLVTSPNQFDEEDIWSLDILEEFAENRNREKQDDEPTFSGRPHRQREAALDASTAAELEDLFDLDNFASRG